MEPKIWIELFGYLGSTLVVVSMLMASVVKLRVINAVGSVISATYALIIGSFPLALMNICLIVINGYNLYKLLSTRQEYDLVAADPGEASVRFFLNRYREDIRKYFPDFENACSRKAFLVYCNGHLAGLLLGDAEGETMDVTLDYSLPAFRDCSVGRFLYKKLPEMGIRRLRFCRSCSAAHGSYLRKMGFHREDGGYRREL